VATELLVANSIDGGRKLLEALDRAGFPVNAAFWYLHEGTWRFLIASSVVDAQGPMEAYRKVNGILQANVTGLNLSDIAVISSHDPRVRLLRTVAGTPPQAIIGVRFTANTINNVFIEDAYIYRMA